jgi:hypothetical protein
MKIRIVIWASVGALVVIFWTLYIAAISPDSLTAAGVLSILADLTCPISLLGHHALSFGLVLLGNAATYALVGAVVEAIRRHSHARPISL